MVSSASYHFVPCPLGLTGWVKGRHECSSSQHSEMYSLVGLEKITLLSKSSRSPDVRRGRNLSLGCDFFPHHNSPGGQGRPGLGRAGHCSFGSLPYWAEHLTMWLSTLWTWFKGRLPKGKNSNWKLSPWLTARPKWPQHSRVVGVGFSHFWAAWRRPVPC